MIFSRIKDLLGPRVNSEDNTLLTGLPRSGTTLACYLLSQTPNVVALNEPVQFGGVRSKEEIKRRTTLFLNQTRTSLLRERKAYNKVKTTGATYNHFSDQDEKGKRKKLISRELVTFDKELTPKFTLIVKHNAAFTVAYDELIGYYKMFAMVRNPIAVLGSWNSVPIPVGKGTLKKNLMSMVPDLVAFQNADLFERQVMLLDWYFGVYAKMSRDRIIKYEDVVSSNGAELGKIINSEVSSEMVLSSKNTSSNYSHSVMKQVGQLVLAKAKNCWEFYSREEVEKIIDELEG